MKTSNTMHLVRLHLEQNSCLIIFMSPTSHYNDERSRATLENYFPPLKGKQC